MTGQSRRWMRLMRYAICAIAVSWLVFRTDWAELKHVLASANWFLVFIGLLVFGPATLLISIRLKLILGVHDVNLSVWQAIKVTFACNFIINALPVGTSGGDAVKAYYIARDTPHKHEAVTCVFFDRAVGLAGLLLISGLALLVNWHNPAFAGWGRVIGALIALLFGGGAIYYSHRMRRLLRLDQLVAVLPFSDHAQRIDRALFGFRHSIRRLLVCFVLTALLQGFSIICVFLVGWALGMVGDQPLRDLPVYLAYTPICFLAGALPIGVMEETFNQLLVESAGLGTREAAYSLSLLCRFIQLVWALPGLLVVLQSRPQPLEESDSPESGDELSAPA